MIKKFGFVACILFTSNTAMLWSCKARSVQNSSRVAAAAYQPIGINDILTIAKAHPKLEDTLQNLPKSLRSSFTLVHSPEGSQHGDPYNPRVILFSAVDNVIVSFNSNDSKFGGHDELEIIYYKEESPNGNAELEFYTLKFDPNGKLPVQDSKPNPQECMGACHGKAGELHYIWGDYPNWPTVYGDGMYESGESPDKFEKDKTKKKGLSYKEFVNALRKQPRYSSLIFIDDNAPYACSQIGCKVNSRITPLVGRLQARLLMTKLRKAHYNQNVQKKFLEDLYDCNKKGSDQFSDFRMHLAELNMPSSYEYWNLRKEDSTNKYAQDWVSTYWSGLGSMSDFVRAETLKDYQASSKKQFDYPRLEMKPIGSYYYYYAAEELDRFDRLATVAIGPDTELSWKFIISSQLNTVIKMDPEKIRDEVTKVCSKL